MALSRQKENLTSYPIASLVKRLLHVFKERLEEELRPHGATAAQLPILFALEREPGISGAKLARACTVTPQTTQVLLRGIEANGWILRTKHPENDRILLAKLTPEGKRVLARARIVVRDIYEAMLDGLSAEEIKELGSLLSRCAANLDLGKRVHPHAGKRNLAATLK
jgi:DNA-binding MarR family transcriptional regulator